MKRNSERWDWWLRRTCFLSLVGSIEDAFKDWSSKSIGSASIGQAQRQSFSFFHGFSMIFYVFTVYRRVLGHPQTSRSTKLDCGPLVKMWLSRRGWFNGCGCCSELPLRGKSDNANETPLRRPCSTSFFRPSYELKLWTKVVGIVVAPVHTKDSFLVFFSRKFLGNFYHSGLGACQRCRCPAPSGSFEWTSERWRFSPVTQPDGSGFRWSRCVASDEKSYGEHLFFGGCTMYFIGWEGGNFTLNSDVFFFGLMIWDDLTWWCDLDRASRQLFLSCWIRGC